MPGDRVSTAPDRLAAAHARLVHDPSFQFGFTAPPKPQPPPNWLAPLIRWLTHHLPVQWLFWGVLAIGVLAVLVLLTREFLLYRRPDAKAAKLSLKTGPEAWRPSAARARALLADADRLAAEGRYGEAAHVLLHRSIDDIDEKRPHLIAPAFTSRDIARIDALPATARDAFSLIARHVERSLFGGRALDATAFAECRRAYEAFALSPTPVPVAA